jgi:GNAT superfamily N-acetyltransferase
MTMMWNGREIGFLPAGPPQTAEVQDVLDEAAAWLHERQISQWPRQFTAAWLEPAISRGETWLVTVDGAADATITLDWSDSLWADVDGNGEGDGTDGAGYVHRMAVRRRAAGLGAVLLRWAADETLRQGRGALRLDCVAANARLRAYYEAAGFAHRDEVPVRGAPGQRLAEGPAVMVSRYELALRWSAGSRARASTLAGKPG